MSKEDLEKADWTGWSEATKAREFRAAELREEAKVLFGDEEED